MTDKEWHDCYNIHTKGTFRVCQAAWPIFRKQKYGRIVTTASSVGVHGNFGQANYSTAKSAIIGLTKTLAIEGKKYGILANCLIPSAGTAMTRTIVSAGAACRVFVFADATSLHWLASFPVA